MYIGNGYVFKHFKVAKKIEAEILEHNFDASPSIVVEIRASKTEEELLRLKALVGKMSLEQAVETERIEGLEIEQV